MSYVLTGYKWGEPVYGRPSGTITYGFDPSFFSDLRIGSGSIGEFEVAAEFALETWEAVADIDFQPAPAGTTPDLTFTMGFLAGSTIGQALTSFIEMGAVDEVTSSVVTLDSGEVWSPFGEVGLNFYNVVLHEVGHSLGLDHPDDPTQVMYAFYNSDETLSLGTGDIAGIRLIYGTARETVFGTLSNDVIDRSLFGIAEEIFALAGDDIVFGTQADDEISGGSGNDRVSGEDGADLIADMIGDGVLQGGLGDDRIFAGIGNSTLSGDAGNDVLVGGTGNDALRGGAGNDLVQGDPAGVRVFGNDRLDGGTGDDLLMGGGGADVFVFRAAGGRDTIAAFDVNWRDPASTAAFGRDFTPGLDTIEFESGTFSSAAAVYAATETVGGNAVITFGSTTLTVFGVTEAELSADSFIFGGAIA